MTDPKWVREINLHYYTPKRVQLLLELAAELAVHPHHLGQRQQLHDSYLVVVGSSSR